MATVEREVSSAFANKEEIKKLVAEVNERMGFVRDTAATAQKAREMMQAEGVRPEENAFTADLMRMRYEES